MIKHVKNIVFYTTAFNNFELITK